MYPTTSFGTYAKLIKILIIKFKKLLHLNKDFSIKMHNCKAFGGDVIYRQINSVREGVTKKMKQDLFY